MKPIRLGKRDSAQHSSAVALEPTVSEHESINPTSASCKPNNKQSSNDNDGDPHIPDPACPICQIDVGKKSPEGIKESWAQTPCGHVFGNVCLKRYLALMVLEKPTCPICRQNIHHACGHPTLPMPYSQKNATTATVNHDNAATVIRRRSTQGKLVKKRPISAAEKGRQHYWGTSGNPNMIACRYCYDKAVAEMAAGAAARPDSAGAGDDQDREHVGQDGSTRSSSSGSTIRPAPPPPPRQQRRTRPLNLVAAPWRIVNSLVRNRRWRLVRRILRKKESQPLAPGQPTNATADGEDAGATDVGSTPPVPGPYGHWELATNEPDWDYMKWFDAQEPKGKTTRDDWAR